MEEGDEKSEDLGEHKIQYLLSLDDLYEHSVGSIGRPNPDTGYAGKPHAKLLTDILPVNSNPKRKNTPVGDLAPDEVLNINTDEGEWLNAWDAKVTLKAAYHEDINAQMTRGGPTVFAPELKSLFTSHWQQAREFSGDPRTRGRHLLVSASIYRMDKRLQMLLYCRLRLDICKLIRPDPVGETGDQVERGILSKIKAVGVQPDIYQRSGRASLSNLYVAISALRELHRQKNGEARIIDDIQFDYDVEDMLQRHDRSHGSNLTENYREVIGAVMLAQRAHEGAYRDKIDEALIYIRTSAHHKPEACRIVPEATPAPNTKTPTSTAHNHGYRNRGRHHINHAMQSLSLHNEYEQESVIEYSRGETKDDIAEEEDWDEIVARSEGYPQAILHTALATAVSAEEAKGGKPSVYCIWCGSTSCQSATGRQCTLVWQNNRTGVITLSTRKFGLLKNLTPDGFSTAMTRACEQGALRGVAPKDLDEFHNLVDQSVAFYQERNDAIEANRGPTNQQPSQYPRQDARETRPQQGYQNGSAYPPRYNNNTGGGFRQGNNTSSPYAAYNPRGN